MKTKTNTNTSIICFTSRGYETALRIREVLGNGIVWIKMKDTDHLTAAKAQPVVGSLSGWTKERFAEGGLLIFVGAAGIAVRSIAPFLESKTTDPAVLCVDEAGTFVIPLISGHIGGGNLAATVLAEGIGATPVITTATDINGKFAVDVFAAENDLLISDLSLAKYVSAAILNGEKIEALCECSWQGTVPEELMLRPCENIIGFQNAVGNQPGNEPGKESESGPAQYASATFRKSHPLRIRIGIHAGDEQVLHLIPKVVTIGLGCRREKDPDEMIAFIDRALQVAGIFPEAVEQIATIDIKQKEPAILAAAAHLNVPVQVFSAQELAAVSGDFTASAFVNETVGVDNVCERSALLGAMQKSRQETRQETQQKTKQKDRNEVGLIVKKKAENGMTLAMAVREWRVHF